MIKRKKGFDLRNYIGKYVKLRYLGTETDEAFVSDLPPDHVGIKTFIDVYRYTYEGVWVPNASRTPEEVECYKIVWVEEDEQ